MSALRSLWLSAEAVALSMLVACSGMDSGPSDASAGTDGGCDEPATGLPVDVFCTGLYINRDPLQHAPEAMAYTPGVTLWSDGAEKQR